MKVLYFELTTSLESLSSGHGVCISGANASCDLCRTRDSLHSCLEVPDAKLLAWAPVRDDGWVLPNCQRVGTIAHHVC
jgi:hypothetical protein